MKEGKLTMAVVNEHAAGIDIGSRSHFVAIDQDRDHVREFGIYTTNHDEMIAFLHQAGVRTVAMESTGSYWQTLFNALQNAGFEVLLVGGAQTKNVKGRKTDILDCMWIQKLHCLGLLSGSFLPSDAIQELRTYYGHRAHLTNQASKYINKMQKTLRLMNLRLDVAIRDITGKSGMAIIEAILNGVRNPDALASLADNRVKRSKEEIAASLKGEWREELIYELRSSHKLYHTYRMATMECDKQIEACIKKRLLSTPAVPSIQAKLEDSKKPKKINKNAPNYNLRTLSYQYFGTDLYAIDGISDGTVLCLLTNMGKDIYKFPTAKRFASWLRLVPNNKISGGKIITTRTPSGKNAIAQMLRQAANSIGNKKEGPLNQFFKRIAYRKGRMAAITATARKLAIIIWNMITKQVPYNTHQVVLNTQKQKRQLIRRLEKGVVALNLSDDEIANMFARCSNLTL